MDFPRTLYTNVEGALQSMWVKTEDEFKKLTGKWGPSPLAVGVETHPSSTGPVDVKVPPSAIAVTPIPPPSQAQAVQPNIAVPLGIAVTHGVTPSQLVVTREQAAANLAAAAAKAKR